MTGPNECRFILCTTELTGTSHRQGQILRGMFTAPQTSAEGSAWMLSLVSSMAVSVSTLPFGRSLASAEQRRYCTEVAPVLSLRCPSCDAAPERLKRKGRVWLPSYSIGQWEGRGRKERKNPSAPCVSLSASSWWGAATSLPIRSLQKRWAHLIWLGLSPSDSVCN